MYCAKCGEQLPQAAGKCLNCGAVIDKEDSKEFYSYDYLTIAATQQTAGEVMDCYECLGWKLSNTHESFGASQVNLHFRRDRKIKNKENLIRLQTRLDDEIKGIFVLEKKKTTTGIITALVLGVTGTMIFGGGLSLALLNPTVLPIISGSILGLIGIGIAALAYPFFKKIIKKKTEEINPMINKKRDEISSICEEAGKYL